MVDFILNFSRLLCHIEYVDDLTKLVHNLYVLLLLGLFDLICPHWWFMLDQKSIYWPLPDIVFGNFGKLAHVTVWTSSTLDKCCNLCTSALHLWTTWLVIPNDNDSFGSCIDNKVSPTHSLMALSHDFLGFNCAEDFV